MGWRLGKHVRLEPLVSGWPAWWCNVAPGPATLHAHRYQLPALRSYLRNPASHVKAANDPRLAGGQFVGVPVEHAGEMQKLLAAMEVEYADTSAFAEAWLDGNEHVRQVALGQTCEPLYADLPDSLGGLVEIGYDYESRSSLRLDEGLAYASSLYRPSRQAVLFRAGRADDARSFYMSTPVVAKEGTYAQVPFASASLGALLDTDVRPLADREAMVAALRAVSPELAAHAAELVEEGGPLAEAPWAERSVRVRHIGHACVLVQYAGYSILLDPFVPQGEHAADVFGWDRLPERIDLALVTHAHPDHFDLETLVRLRPRVDRIVVPHHRGLLIGDVSLRRVLREVGYRDVLELDTADRIELPDGGEMIVLPFLGEHGDLHHGSKAAYFVRLAGVSMLFAADSACLDVRTYRRVREMVGPIKHVFMNTEVDGAPVSWPFDALFPKKRDRKLESTRRCRGSNVEEGLNLLAEVQAENLYLYAMGLEPWIERITGPASTPESSRMRAAEELVAKARAAGRSARRLVAGEESILPPDGPR